MDEIEEKVRLSISTGHSPSIIKRRIERKIEVEDKTMDIMWKSACFTVDRRAVQYFTQTALISLTMVFCVYQLLTLDNCEAQTTYMGLLTMLLGLIIPSPKFDKK